LATLIVVNENGENAAMQRDHGLVRRGYPHPLHAILLGGALTLFVGALLSDWAYSSSAEIQWKNFSSWLLVGALVLSGFALLWAAIGLVRGDNRGARLFYPLALLAAWIAGFVNALIHAKDAWASMPDAVILSVVTVILIALAVWLGFSKRTPRFGRGDLA
jgi:uncharacterized membrane protein